MPALPPNAPNPGAWLWILYDNRHLTLMHLPTNWPTTPANQIVTINVDTLPGFGIPASYELYDVATGAGNTGLGIFYTTAWVIGRDPATGARRAQMVGMSPGTPPGGCFTFGALQTLNISPVSIGSVEYPQGYIANHFWSLEQPAAVEPGTSTPDQTLTLRHLPTGGLPVLPPVDEDQILCAPGLSGCPNWGDTLIEQITGDAVHLLLRNQSTGAQRIGLLNLGNAGFGGFNSCAGSVNPCLYQIRNLPAQVSGNVIDIAGETFVPDRVWVLWAEGLTTPSATSETDDEINGPSAALFENFPLQSPAVTYRLSALGSDGSLIGAIPLGTGGGSSGGGGGAPGIEVILLSIDFGAAAIGSSVERSFIIRNTGRADLKINSMTLINPNNSPYSYSDFTGAILRSAGSMNGFIRFTPKDPGVFPNTLIINSSDSLNPMVKITLTGRGQPTVSGISKIELVHDSVDFGTVDTFRRAARGIVIRNIGRDVLRIDSMRITDPVSNYLDFDPPFEFPSFVQPGEAQQAWIIFHPRMPGSFQGELVIRSNDPDEAITRIPITGRSQMSRGNLTPTLNIDRGCGAGYRVGEPINIFLQSPRDAMANLKVLTPDGSERLLFSGLLRAGQRQALSSVVGEPAGEWTLNLEVVAGGQRGWVECGFTGFKQDDDDKLKFKKVQVALVDYDEKKGGFKWPEDKDYKDINIEKGEFAAGPIKGSKKLAVFRVYGDHAATKGHKQTFKFYSDQKGSDLTHAQQLEANQEFWVEFPCQWDKPGIYFLRVTAIKPDYDVIAWQVKADVPDPKTKWIDVYCDPSVLFAENDASIAGGVLTQKIRMKWGWAGNLTQEDINGKKRSVKITMTADYYKKNAKDIVTTASAKEITVDITAPSGSKEEVMTVEGKVGPDIKLGDLLLISEVKVKLELIGDMDSNEANNTLKLSVPIKKL